MSAQIIYWHLISGQSSSIVLHIRIHKQRRVKLPGTHIHRATPVPVVNFTIMVVCQYRRHLVHGNPLIFLAYTLNRIPVPQLAGILPVKLLKHIGIIAYLLKDVAYCPIRHLFYIIIPVVQECLEGVTPEVTIHTAGTILRAHRIHNVLLCTVHIFVFRTVKVQFILPDFVHRHFYVLLLLIIWRSYLVHLIIQRAA